jgi:hypothetical protein
MASGKAVFPSAALGAKAPSSRVLAGNTALPLATHSVLLGKGTPQGYFHFSKRSTAKKNWSLSALVQIFYIKTKGATP